MIYRPGKTIFHQKKANCGSVQTCPHHQPRFLVSTQERIWVGAILVNAAVLLVLSLDPDALLCAGRDPPGVGDLHHPEGRDRWSELRIAGPCRCVPLLLTSVTSTQMTPNVGSGGGGRQLTAPTRTAAIWLPPGPVTNSILFRLLFTIAYG